MNHEVMGCTNMACTGMPYEAWHLDPNNDPTIGPPQRPGMLNYRSGHGRVADPSGWPCQIGSSWLEQGGCVKCNCNRKAIRCRDSGLCLNGELVSNDLARAQMVRRRRDADSDPAAGAAPAPATAAAPVGEPTAAAVETTAAPVAVPTVAPVVTTDTTTAIPAETTAAPAGAGAVDTTDVPAAAVDGTTASPAALDASNTTQAPPSVALPPQNTGSG
ncbi:hypothetical protein FOCC_FOCC017489 [Frankliniella occidentalis]|nr:hypothetical protein FOCC_FOCC017489 [Frankliniella occidentalis]